MKFAVVSDTLGILPEIKGKYDFFVHCGNFCPVASGDHSSIQSQIDWLHNHFRPWLDSIDANHKIIIPGHSDIAVSYLEPNFEFHIDAVYLRDQAATLNGLVVYGMPWIPYTLRSHALSKSSFTARNSAMYEAAIERIPDNVNMLITRIPPQGILDRFREKNIGDKSLLEKIENFSQLRMHFFGFAPDSGGEYFIRGNQLFANGYLGEAGYIDVEISSGA
jgi:hypothetical protein